MKKVFWLLLVFLSFVGCSAKQGGDKVDPDVQVGIYDSRSIAVAFIGSDVYNKTEGLVLKQWLEEYKIAKSENDQQKIKDLESKGQSQQEKLHLQGFGTAPVDDILAYIPEEINNFKQQNNIQLLISKWDSKTLAGCEEAEKIDVTTSLIEAFGPTDKQRQSALAIQKFKPVENKKLHGKID